MSTSECFSLALKSSCFHYLGKEGFSVTSHKQLLWVKGDLKRGSEALAAKEHFPPILTEQRYFFLIVCALEGLGVCLFSCTLIGLFFVLCFSGGFLSRARRKSWNRTKFSQFQIEDNNSLFWWSNKAWHLLNSMWILPNPSSLTAALLKLLYSWLVKNDLKPFSALISVYRNLFCCTVNKCFIIILTKL